MQNREENLSERLLEYAANSVRLAANLNRNVAGRHIRNQLMRSATSSGANYQEACAAESRADFVHKMQIVLKELRESRYWLNLLGKLGAVKDLPIANLIKESDELIKIFAKSVITAKARVR